MKKSKLVNIIISPGGSHIGEQGATITVYRGDKVIVGTQTKPADTARLSDQLAVLTKEYVKRYFISNSSFVSKKEKTKTGIDYIDNEISYKFRIRLWKLEIIWRQ